MFFAPILKPTPPLKPSLAALSLTAFVALSAPAAFADNHSDMSCADFMVMGADDQRGVLAGLGREGARDAATGDDPDVGGGTSDIASVDGGRDDARAMMTGSDEDIVTVSGACADDPNLTVPNAMKVRG